MEPLLQAIEASASTSIPGLLKDKLNLQDQAWKIHLSLFPIVQRVTNPQFINPHLPKMYAICREFLPYLKPDEIAALVRLEINEYARRPKLPAMPKLTSPSRSVTFQEIETAVGEENREKTAVLFNTYLEQKGQKELARKLLILGSGYLEPTLGHSVSCTAFILLEMLERPDQDPWPALTVLAEYFCAGRFKAVPALRTSPDSFLEEALNQHLLKAVSGSGIVNLHHTITRYAVERVRHLMNEAEYRHLLAAWIDFMGPKETTPVSVKAPSGTTVSYDNFNRYLAQRDDRAALSAAAEMIYSPESRHQLGSYFIKAACDLYQGDYDPHFINGLGSLLWVVNHNPGQPQIVTTALAQYIGYFSQRK